MTARLVTIAELDKRMGQVYATYCAAMDSGDLELADRKYAEMDLLLDARCHHPAER